MKTALYKQPGLAVALICSFFSFSAVAGAKPPELKTDAAPFAGGRGKSAAPPQDAPALDRKIKGAAPAEAIKILKDHILRSGRDPDRAPGPVHDAGTGKPPPARTRVIHVPGGDFVPEKGVEGELRRKIRGIPAPESKDRQIVVIIQLERDISLNETIGLHELGMTYLGGIGDSAVIAKVPAAAVGNLEKLPFVRWIGEYKDEYKFNPAQPKNARKGSRVYPLDTGRAEYEQSLRELGLAVSRYDETANCYHVILDEERFPQAARLGWVKRIEKDPVEVPEALNYEPDDSRELVNAPNTWSGYTGSGVRVGVRDAGIWSAHPDLNGIFLADSELATNNSHGTHVTGIIAGRGTRNIEGQYDAKGVAYNASVLFRNYNTTTHNGAFSIWAGNSVEISNHSYALGVGDYSYSLSTEDFDAYADDNAMIVVKSAGNDGPAAGTITNPGTGKNVVAVGAVSYTPASIGEVASYSSRGPTQDDGRLKPELVAPGTDIVSANNNSSTGDWPTDPYYTRMDGTSMAAPHAAGAFALYRQFLGSSLAGYTEYAKALMINTAIPIKANTNTASYGYANNNAGYGLINPFSTIYSYSGESDRILGQIDWLTETANEFDEWSFTVPAGTKRLLVTMVYNDEQGETSDSKALIDNLDLNLKAPGGSYYWGGYPSGVTNEGTIEKMAVENPASGTWYAKVSFYSYPASIFTSQQRYALVAHAIYKTPELSVSGLPATYYVARGENLMITPIVTNTGGYIAAGATLEISGSASFGGDINTKKYAGNLMYQNHALSATFNLVTPMTDGSYPLTVKGNGINLGLAEATLNTTVIVDETAPGAPAGLSANPSGWTTTNSFSIDWTNPGDVSGIVGAYYKLGSAPTSPTDGFYKTSKPFTVSATVEGGQTIYVWLRDAAGNVNENNRSSTLLNLDINPPSYPLSLNATPSGWTNTNSFSINWTNPSEPSGIAGAYYKLGSAPTFDTNGTYTTDKPFTTPATAEGGQTIHVWLKDGAGNATYLNRAWITLYYDGTAPAAPAGLTVTPGGWTNTNSFSINWTNPSDISGIAGVYYKLGSAPASGTDGTLMTTKPFTAAATAQGGQTIYVWLKDGAGNADHNNRSTGVLYYDATAPAAPVDLSATPASWSNTNSFSINWTNPADSAGIAGAYYKRASAPASPADGTYTTAKPFPVSASAQGGETLYVWLKDILGNADHNNRSSVVLYYDGTPPSNIAAVSDGAGADAAYTTSLSQLSANWSGSSDAQSGMARYWYAVGTAAGATNVVGWRDNGLATSTTASGLSMTNGQMYYFTVKAENGVGLQSGATNSNGQKADATAPSNITAVSDGSAADVAWSTSSSRLSANWSASLDGESGLARYWYAIGTAAGGTNVAGWRDNGVALSTTASGLSLTDGQIYYFTVKAENGAGLQSAAANSNGQTVDTAAPNSSVSGLGQYTNGAAFNVTWSGIDGVSGLGAGAFDVQYKVGPGSWADWVANSSLTSKIFGPASPAAVQHGQTYSFRCRARDNAGNAEAWGAGADAATTVDLSSPSAPALASATHVPGDWNTVSNSPQFSWTASDAGSGIAGYSAVLDRSAGSVPGPAVNLIANSTTFANVADGTWYFHARTRDNAGNWSPAASYGPVMIDLTAPAFAIAPSRNPAPKGNMTLTVTAGEQLSVITASVTQSGGLPAGVPLTSADNITWTGNYTVVSGYDGPAAIDVSGKDIPGKHGSGSASFVVDTASPSAPSGLVSATHPENVPKSNANPVFTWTASADPGGSGVAGYSWAVAQSADYALDLATETAAAWAALSRPDGTYWFHVRGVDNAGNGSPAASYKFVIDVTSPVYATSYSRNPAGAGDLVLVIDAGEALKAAPAVGVRQAGQAAATGVTMGSSDNVSWSGNYTVVSGYDGATEVTISGTDLADNTGTGSGGFQADTIGPTAAVTLSPGGSLRTGPFTAGVTIADASAIIGTPVLAFTAPGQQAVTLTMSGSDKSWTASGYIQSVTSTGTAVFAFSAEDAAGNAGTALTAGGSFGIDTSVSGAGGGSVTNSDETGVVVEPGTYAGGLLITIAVPDPGRSDIAQADGKLSGPAPVPGANLRREYLAQDLATGAPLTAFSRPLRLTIAWPDADNDGLIDGAGVRERRAGLFRLNPAAGAWEEVSGAEPDFASNKISAQVTHFSVYSILTVSPESVVYPVPWKPGSGGRFDSANDICGAGIIFDNLTADAIIRIYNYQGELLRELKLTAADNGCKGWDGRNSAGRDVASGIYLAVIKASPSGAKSIRKLAIER